MKTNSSSQAPFHVRHAVQIAYVFIALVGLAGYYTPPVGSSVRGTVVTIGFAVFAVAYALWAKCLAEPPVTPNDDTAPNKERG